MAALNKERLKMRADFLRKYPNADLCRFEFVITTDTSGKIISKDFYFKVNKITSININKNKNDPEMNKYLHLKRLPFPLICRSFGTIQKIPISNIKNVEEYKLADQYPANIVLNYPTNNFKVYVNETKFFMSKLPKLSLWTDETKSKWEDNNFYYQACFAMYCATYCCGVSIQHLTPNVNAHHIITSLMRFHVYFTIRRLLIRMLNAEKISSLSTEFKAGDFYDKIEHIPRLMIFSYKDGVIYHLYKDKVATDYMRYVPQKSNGLTDKSIEYIGKSIESFKYCILGTQANTR